MVVVALSTQTAGWGRDKEGGGGCVTDVGGKVVVDVSSTQREALWEVKSPVFSD